MECYAEPLTVKEAVRSVYHVPFFHSLNGNKKQRHDHHHQLFPQPLKLWLYESENGIFF